MKNLIKYLFLGFLLLFLFHFESLSIGPVKVSHLWKGVLLLFLLVSVFRKKNVFVFIYKPLLFLGVIQVLNVELINNTFNAILLFGTTLILPLLGIYVLKYNVEQLKKSLLFFAAFFILCFIPYQLGILTSIEEGYKLSSYSAAENTGGLVGPFQTVHSASTALAGAFLVVLYFWLAKAFNRIYLTTLLILGFYFLIATYVRTGMAMVIVGALPMIIYYAKKDASTRGRLIIVGGILSILIGGWVLSNETLMDRITGERVAAHKSETDSFESLGSGRGGIYISSLEIFAEANIFEQIIGMGQTEELKRMENKIGSGIVPHNGFLLLLLNNGLLGLFLFLYFLRKIYKKQKRIYSDKKHFIKGLLFAYVVMTFFQNFDMIYMYLILVLGIAYTMNPIKSKATLPNNS